MLIVFEGCDGAGKTTQTENVSRALTERGLKNVVYKFPDSAKFIGMRIRELLSDPLASQLDLQLLFAIERLQVVSEIQRKVAEGEIVLIDRFGYSGIVYGTVSGVDEELLKAINEYNLSIDLIVYLKLDEARVQPPEKSDCFDNAAFQRGVIDGYNDLFKHEKNVITINANLSEKKIESLILEKILENKQVKN